MALRRALSRLIPAASEAVWDLQRGTAVAAATVCARQQVLQPQQWRQPSSYGFATSAAVQQAAAAPAAAAAAAGPCAVPAAAAQLPDVYVPLDSPITEKYSVAPKRVFAVVEVGGTQYKVTPNDVIVVEKLAGVDVNDRLQLRRVLLLGSQAETIIGRPYVPDACVTAAVEEQFLDGKVLIFHKRRRKNSRRLRGHRQPLTTLRILDVHGIAEAEVPAAAAAAGAGAP